MGFVAHCEKCQQDLWLGIKAREVHYIPAAMRPAVHASRCSTSSLMIERKYCAPRFEALQHSH